MTMFGTATFAVPNTLRKLGKSSRVRPKPCNTGQGLQSGVACGGCQSAGYLAESPGRVFGVDAGEVRGERAPALAPLGLAQHVRATAMLEESEGSDYARIRLYSIC